MKTSLGLRSQVSDRCQWVVLSLFLALCACDGISVGLTKTGSVSKETKQAVADYKTRWDMQAKVAQEMTAVLKQHLAKGATAAPTKSIGSTDRIKAKFAQQRLRTPVDQVLSGRVDRSALEAELEQIADKFEQEEKAFRPDMSAALAANFGMELTEDGNVVVGDQGIDTSSMMGVATAVVMNAKARGESPETAVNYLRAEMLKKIKENPPLFILEDENDAPEADGNSPGQVTSQSLYVQCPSWGSFIVQGYDCGHWYKRIPYVFDGKVNNFADTELVEAVEKAMQDWTNKTGGKVKFYRATRGKRYSPWRFAGVLNITRTSKPRSRALVGYGSGLREFRISNMAFEKNLSGEFRNPEWLKYSARHELGHTIGLIHEQQRWDRDNYLEISPTDLQKEPANYTMIGWNSSTGRNQLEWELQTVGSYDHLVCTWRGWFDIECHWERKEIKIWVPVWKYVITHTERTGYGSVGFDFHSIMLYRDLLVKLSALPSNCSCSSCSPCFYVDKSDGKAKTNYNVEISDQDAATAADLMR